MWRPDAAVLAPPVMVDEPALAAAPRPGLHISQGQSEYLDAVRGVAAQLVLVQHLLTVCFPASGLDEYGLGALGVLAFFLLSGFLITDSMAARVRAGRFTATEFVVSRFSRIYTPFLPALLLVAVLDWFSSGMPGYEYVRDYNLHTALANVLMLQDFPLFQILRRLHVPDQAWFTKSFGSGRQFWTVSIEWWIYVVAGVGTALVLRAPGSERRPARLMIAVLAFAAVEPLYNLVGGPGDSLTLFWLLGAGAALLYRRFGRCCPRRSWVAVTVLLIALLALRLLFTHGRVYDAVFALLLCGVVFLPMSLRPGQEPFPVLRRLRLDRLSFHSYSLYLTHGSIVVLLAMFHPGQVLGLKGLLLLVAVTNVFAVVFAALFEVPHRRVRQWLLQRIGPGARA